MVGFYVYEFLSGVLGSSYVLVWMFETRETVVCGFDFFGACGGGDLEDGVVGV